MKMGERIKELRLSKSMTLEELGKLVGVQKAAVQKWENGSTKNLKRSTIEKLSKIFNVTPSYLMGLDTEYIKADMAPAILKNIVMLPVVGIVRAGQPILAVENIEGYFPMEASCISSDKEYFFLKVRGDSMNLEFDEGSLLLVEKVPDVENGEIGVVLVNGFEATVKKIVKNDNMITLIPMSNNPIHTPQMIDISKQDVSIIGRIKMAIKQY
jgi:repressor LexA